MTHTPGPWHAHPDAANPRIILVGSDDMWVCKLFTSRGYDQTDEQATANADLIASAPDLLDALRGICDMVGAIEDGAYSSDLGRRRVWDEKIDQARAAIALAEGEE